MRPILWVLVFTVFDQCVGVTVWTAHVIVDRASIVCPVASNLVAMPFGRHILARFDEVFGEAPEFVELAAIPFVARLFFVETFARKCHASSVAKLSGMIESALRSQALASQSIGGPIARLRTGRVGASLPFFVPVAVVGGGAIVRRQPVAPFG